MSIESFTKEYSFLIEGAKSLVQKYEQVLKSLNNSELEYSEVNKLSKEKSDLDDQYIKCNNFLNGIVQYAECLDLVEYEDDPEMLSFAKSEAIEIYEDLKKQVDGVKLSLIPADTDDKKDIIVEIRSGTGGDEAALFVQDLLKIYQKFAELNSWKFEIINVDQGNVCGMKEVSFSISGDDVYSVMKFESGTHRVQRIPKTESSGRVHTSAVTVAIMPQVKDVDVDIDFERDVKVDVYRASGAGGQHVNTTESAVRMTHLPTGIVVAQQTERSQLKNRDRAKKILMAKVYAHFKAKQENEQKEERKIQIGSGDRSEKIRTYNYPQNRITDHRNGFTMYNLSEIIISGDIKEVVNSLKISNNNELIKKFCEQYS